jgi:hypothetical protein
MEDSTRPAPGLVKRPVLQVSVLRKIPHFRLVSNRFFCNFFGVGGFCFFWILGFFRYCQLWEQKNRESAANWRVRGRARQPNFIAFNPLFRKPRMVEISSGEASVLIRSEASRVRA